jgi:hypothetical protein
MVAATVCFRVVEVRYKIIAFKYLKKAFPPAGNVGAVSPKRIETRRTVGICAYRF